MKINCLGVKTPMSVLARGLRDSEPATRRGQRCKSPGPTPLELPVRLTEGFREKLTDDRYLPLADYP